MSVSFAKPGPHNPPQHFSRWLDRRMESLIFPYMDAPSLPSTFLCSSPQEEIAPIHSASVVGAWPRTLMEYAGGRLTNKPDS